jgi:hypothetical protein
VASGSWPTVQLLLSWSSAYGCRLSLATPGPLGLTPLHLLVAAPGAAELLQPLVLHHRRAAQLWFSCEAVDGCSPAQHAEIAGRRHLNSIAGTVAQRREQRQSAAAAAAPSVAEWVDAAAAAAEAAPTAAAALLQRRPAPPAPSLERLPLASQPEQPVRQQGQLAAGLGGELDKPGAGAGPYGRTHDQDGHPLKLRFPRGAAEGYEPLLGYAMQGLVRVGKLVLLAVCLLALAGLASTSAAAQRGTSALRALDAAAGLAVAVLAAAMMEHAAVRQALLLHPAGSERGGTVLQALDAGVPLAGQGASAAARVLAAERLAEGQTGRWGGVLGLLSALASAGLAAALAGSRVQAHQPPLSLTSWAAEGGEPLQARGRAALLLGYCWRVAYSGALAAPALMCATAERVPRGYGAATLPVLFSVLTAASASVGSLHQGAMLMLLCWRHLSKPGQRNGHLLRGVVVFDLAMTVLSVLLSGQALLPLVLTELALLSSFDVLLGWVMSGSLPGRGPKQARPAGAQEGPRRPRRAAAAGLWRRQGA